MKKFSLVLIATLALVAPAQAASFSFGTENFSFSISDNQPRYVEPHYEDVYYDDECWDDACEYAYEDYAVEEPLVLPEPVCVIPSRYAQPDFRYDPTVCE